MEAIKDKIKKLLQLASSNNENEAALAMAMAQELMDKHNIAMAELSASEKVMLEDIIEDKEPLFAAGRIPGWKSILANILARNNNCRLLTFRTGYRGKDRETKLIIYGRPSDIDHVRYLLAYAITQLTRLSHIPCMGEGHRYKDSWYHGAVSGINEKLSESKQKVMTTASSFAVNKYNDWGREVESFMHSLHKIKTGKSSNSKIDSEAYNKGKAAGRNVDLGGSKRVGVNQNSLGMR